MNKQFAGLPWGQGWGWEWSGVKWMEGGRKKPGRSDECWSGEIAGWDRGTDGWMSEEE